MVKKGNKMKSTPEVQLGILKIREKNILARGKYQKAPGVLKKVQRQIKALESCKN